MTSQKTILRALAGETLPTPPIWMMRQAGRYLPEYRATRAQAGDFLSLCYNSELAAEVTLQPIRRYGFDASILFADILLLPQALGADLWFVTGEGPRLSTITDPGGLALSRQIDAGAEVVKLFDSWAGSLQGDDFVNYAVKPAQKITAALKAKYPHVPVIAFPRGAGEKYVGLHAAIGADCIALDDGVTAEWAAANVQTSGCTQGNLKSSHMVTGGQDLVDAS